MTQDLAEKFIQFDLLVTETLAQPIQDMVSEWRGRSDHLLAVLLMLATVALLPLAVLFHGRASPWIAAVVIVGNTLFVSVLAAAVGFYGHVFRNSNRPGALSGPYNAFIRQLMCGVFMLIDMSYLISAPSMEHALRLAVSFLWYLSWVFGAVALKRPPPPKPRASLVPAFQGAG